MVEDSVTATFDTAPIDTETTTFSTSPLDTRTAKGLVTFDGSIEYRGYGNQVYGGARYGDAVRYALTAIRRYVRKTVNGVIQTVNGVIQTEEAN